MDSNNSKERRQFIIVKGLVVDKNNQLLLVRRKREWHKEAHDKWEFPGGKVDFGETPEEATVREIKEESGYDAKIKSLLPKILSSKWEFEDRESQQLLICYICELIGGEAILQDKGVSDIKWYAVAEALKLESLPGTREFIEEYKKTL